MDYFGSPSLLRQTLNASLRFNPSGSMDYFGSIQFYVYLFVLHFVSILLGQWITLEVTRKYNIWGSKGKSFNPSGSMDYFGRAIRRVRKKANTQFQSFWVNGLLWKSASPFQLRNLFNVSILLGQWITLEDFNGLEWMPWNGRMFQSFWVNGLLWKYYSVFPRLSAKKVSILLGQWITLEVIHTVQVTDRDGTFQSFWVNGLLWKKCQFQSSSNE